MEGRIMFESNDTFVEEAVKVKESPADKAKKTFPLTFTFLLMAVMIASPAGLIRTVLSLLTIGSGLFAIYMFGYKNIEFEYDYTNGSLEIAKIINNEKNHQFNMILMINTITKI